MSADLAAQMAAMGMPFPEPCSCTDPKGHRADCPAGGSTADDYAVLLSNPGDDYVKFARVGQRLEWYPGEAFDTAMSWGLPHHGERGLVGPR